MIAINADGSITLKPGCVGQLCVSAGSTDHAAYYIANKRPDGTVVVFEVDRATHNRIVADAVPQLNAPRGVPQIVDQTKSGTSISLQLPDFYAKLMVQNASKGRVLSQEDFLREFGTQ